MNAQKFKKIMAEVRSEMNKISDIQEELFMNTMKAALIKEESDAYFHAWTICIIVKMMNILQRLLWIIY